MLKYSLSRVRAKCEDKKNENNGMKCETKWEKEKKMRERNGERVREKCACKYAV